MSKKHRTWQIVLAYFKEIPIHNNIDKVIQCYLNDNKNVLIMINRENPETNPKYTPEEKHKALHIKFKNEIIKGKVILSIVPEIDDFTMIAL